MKHRQQPMKDWLKRRSFVYAQRGTESARGIGRRILVHIVSILAAAAMASDSAPVPGWPMDMSDQILATYFGLICLFPGGLPRRADWLVPVAGGLFVTLVQAVFGVPWAMALFSGGLQTFLLRVLCKKTRLGWEWLVTPWLVLSCFVLSSQIPGGAIAYIGLAAFGVATLCGLVVFGFLTRYVLTPRRRRDLLEASAFLKNALMLDFLPQQFFGPLSRLAEQAKIMGESLPLLDDSMLRPIMGIRLVRKRVAILQSSSPQPRWDFEIERFLDSVIVLNEDIDALLSRTELLEKSLAADNVESEEDKRFRQHTEMILDLAKKKKKLPKGLQKNIDGLQAATQNILNAMRDDPRDVERGDKFLSRYLVAAHKVIDDYIRLSASDKAGGEVQAVLDRCEDFLGKLEEAFIKEHQSLLRNDTIDLQAEMATIETLMKLDGK